MTLPMSLISYQVCPGHRIPVGLNINLSVKRSIYNVSLTTRVIQLVLAILACTFLVALLIQVAINTPSEGSQTGILGTNDNDNRLFVMTADQRNDDASISWLANLIWYLCHSVFLTPINDEDIVFSINRRRLKEWILKHWVEGLPAAVWVTIAIKLTPLDIDEKLYLGI